MRSSPPTRPLRWTAALGVLATLAFTVSLVEIRAAAVPGHLPPGAAAMRVAIDPETGALVHAPLDPAKALDPTLANMLSRSTEGLIEVHYPDGRVSVNLQGRFQSVSLARLSEAGEVEATCVEDLEQGKAFLEHGTAPRHDHQWEVR
jgi:hypothetical protein